MNCQSSATPIVSEAKWFSTTGSKWQESNGPIKSPDQGAPLSSPYDISCTIVVEGVSIDAPSVQWSAFIPGPGVSPPSVSGTEPGYDWKKISNNDYRSWLTGVGQLTRTGPSLVSNGFDVAKNSFSEKIITNHENVHIDQWDNQDPWQRINSVDFFMSKLNQKTYHGDSYVDVASAPRLAWNSYKQVCAGPANRNSVNKSNGNSSGQELWYARERAAHTQSNGVSPDFLEVDLSLSYQLSGTVIFDWSLPSGWQ